MQKIGMFAAAIVFLTSAFAHAFPGKAPNMYSFAGTGMSISYTTTSIDGKPRLSLKMGGKTVNFSGAQITTSDSALGTLVTVYTMRTIDGPSQSLTIVLPGVRLPANNRQAVTAIAILTNHRGVMIPMPGQLSTSKVVSLRGTATSVMF